MTSGDKTTLTDSQQIAFTISLLNTSNGIKKGLREILVPEFVSEEIYDKYVKPLMDDVSDQLTYTLDTLSDEEEFVSGEEEYAEDDWPNINNGD